MKNGKIIRIAMVCMALAVAVFALPASAKGKKAAMKFKETSYNFGTIPEHGGKVTHDFEFVNEGDANLVIYDAKADCGCTVPEYPKNPIAPGKKGKIRVTYNPLYRPGGFTKVITIRSNGKPKKVRVKITGTVNPNK